MVQNQVTTNTQTPHTHTTYRSIKAGSTQTADKCMLQADALITTLIT
jgi:hypothetical protein